MRTNDYQLRASYPTERERTDMVLREQEKDSRRRRMEAQRKAEERRYRDS
jgi:hypothetical protein